ncbi:hypothetical protein N7481_001857 [Penicillium waksmanii]|uniref:uncharacterized protein n=1 Tax=Penicillium waksmanii TaxID=69791 RepID=UPI0025480D3F|nr:uncharacterized protein N7481_001857 [Penicillium waksmanii]KAJ5994880.1 hypothetical protein N7481_001857 [Penicillium waksmanii]
MLQTFADWVRFLDHIYKYKERKPMQPVIFETFSNVRDLHYLIKEFFIFWTWMTSKRSFIVYIAGFIGYADSEAPMRIKLESQPTSRLNSSSDQDQDDIDEPEYVTRMRSLQIKTDETDGTGGFTDLLRSHNQGPLATRKASEEIAEARINSAFVFLLVTLCLALPTELKWDQI